MRRACNFAYIVWPCHVHRINRRPFAKRSLVWDNKGRHLLVCRTASYCTNAWIYIQDLYRRKHGLCRLFMVTSSFFLFELSLYGTHTRSWSKNLHHFVSSSLPKHVVIPAHTLPFNKYHICNHQSALPDTHFLPATRRVVGSGKAFFRNPYELFDGLTIITAFILEVSVSATVTSAIVALRTVRLHVRGYCDLVFGFLPPSLHPPILSNCFVIITKSGAWQSYFR